MSSAESGEVQIEQRSSIKVTRNAKGEPQWEVKVVVGDELEKLDIVHDMAVAHYKQLERELVGAASVPPHV